MTWQVTFCDGSTVSVVASDRHAAVKAARTQCKKMILNVSPVFDR